MENNYTGTIRISETIRALRQSRGINQEVLAEALSVSTQAVSKWETGSSLPDIMMLPRIAEYFGVTTDHLYFGGEIPPKAEPAAEPTPVSPFPDDGVLRIVQYMGGTMLSAEEAKAGEVIELSLGEAALLADNSEKQIVIPTEIFGSAIINGAVNGNIKAEGDVNCGTVNGNASAEQSLKCVTVNGSVSAGGNVAASRIMGNVSAGGSCYSGADETVQTTRQTVDEAVRESQETEREAEKAARKFEQEFERKFSEAWDREAERSARHAERRESRSFGADFGSFGADFGREMGRFGKELGRAFSFGKKQRGPMPDLPFPDDGALRVVQFIGREPAVWQEGNSLDPIPLEIELAAEHMRKTTLDVHVYGNADISGSVSGNIQADGDISCGDVGGNLTADGDVSCGDAGGNVTADGDVTCGNVGGNVTTDGDVSCGDVSGNVTADGDVSCGDVGGSVSAEGDVECGSVGRDIDCEGNLSCGNINGNVKSCEGDIHCGDIGGSIRCEGDIIRA